MKYKVVAKPFEWGLFDVQRVARSSSFVYTSVYTIIHPLKEVCFCSCLNTEQEIKPHQLLLIAPFCPFKIDCKKKHPDERILFFRVSILGTAFTDSIQFSKIKNMLEQAKNGVLYQVPEDNKITEYLYDLQNLFSFDQVIKLFNLLNLLAKLKPQAYLDFQSFYIKSGPRIEDKVKKIENFILTNLARELTVDDLASYACMARSTFSRFFHKNFGITFREYIITRRMEMAAKYLVSTDWTVMRISSEVGFSTLSNFNSRFKEYFKMSPKEYKANKVSSSTQAPTSRVTDGQMSFHCSNL